LSIYRFNEQSLIDEITVQRSEGGGLRAYIHAREGTLPGKLGTIKNLLNAHEMQWSPVLAGGKPVLEIRGFGKDENGLLRLLGDNDFIIGGYEKKRTVGDVMSFWDKFRKNTLRASGYFYFVGDAGFFSYQWKESFTNGKLTNLPGLLSGVFYALGTPVIAFFGKGDKSDFQLKDLAYNTESELKRWGVEIPKDSAIRVIADGHNEGALKKFTNFLQRYPAEVTNSVFGMAGSMMIWAGIKDYRANAKSKKSIFMDIGLGCMTVLAGLISVFVEEEAPDPDAPKKHGIARAWQYIKEKPLRAAGAALMVSTVSHAGATYKDWKDSKAVLANTASHTAEEVAQATKHKKAIPGRAIFAFTNLSAEALMAVSSKGHGAGVKTDTSLDRSVYAVMADLVYRSPKEGRDLLLGNLSTYLSGKKRLGGHPADIENGIRDQLKALENNPWAGKVKSSPSPTKPEREINWQARTSLSALQAPPAPAMMSP